MIAYATLQDDPLLRSGEQPHLWLLRLIHWPLRLVFGQLVPLNQLGRRVSFEPLLVDVESHSYRHFGVAPCGLGSSDFAYWIDFVRSVFSDELGSRLQQMD